MPLIDNDKVLGVLNVESDYEGGFDTNDETHLTALADLAVIAIRNAESFRELTDMFHELTDAHEELQVLDKRKNEFVSTVSHEFRNPLTTIETIIQILLKGGYGPLNEIQRDRLMRAHSSAQEELQLIEDLLDLSSIQGKTESVDLKSESLAKIIATAIHAHLQQATAKHLDLISDVPVDDSCELLLDGKKIKRVLNNLIENAIKFTAAGSIRVQLATKPDFVEVRVIDTGLGISAEESSKIFDQFYQVDSSLTREYKGHGVGLYLAQKYAEMHGGKIRLEKSQLHVSSTFLLTLPRRQHT